MALQPRFGSDINICVNAGGTQIMIPGGGWSMPLAVCTVHILLHQSSR